MARRAPTPFSADVRRGTSRALPAAEPGKVVVAAAALGPTSSWTLFSLLQDLEHHLGLALSEVQAAKKTWFNRTLSSIKTATGVQGKETC